MLSEKCCNLVKVKDSNESVFSKEKEMKCSQADDNWRLVLVPFFLHPCSFQHSRHQYSFHPLILTVSHSNFCVKDSKLAFPSNNHWFLERKLTQYWFTSSNKETIVIEAKLLYWLLKSEVKHHKKSLNVMKKCSWWTKNFNF